MHTHSHPLSLTHTHTNTHAHKHTHKHTYTHTHTPKPLYKYVHTHTHTRKHMYTHTHIHTYTHTHIHTYTQACPLCKEAVTTRTRSFFPFTDVLTELQLLTLQHTSQMMSPLPSTPHRTHQTHTHVRVPQQHHVCQHNFQSHTRTHKHIPR